MRFFMQNDTLYACGFEKAEILRTGDTLYVRIAFTYPYLVSLVGDKTQRAKESRLRYWMQYHLPDLLTHNTTLSTKILEDSLQDYLAPEVTVGRSNE